MVTIKEKKILVEINVGNANPETELRRYQQTLNELNNYRKDAKKGLQKDTEYYMKRYYSLMLLFAFDTLPVGN